MIDKKNTKEDVLVSVIIPTFGEPKFLKKSIESVVKQTFLLWELIVVDDNDPESQERIKTEKIMDEYKDDKRIIYLKHPKNMNGANARNTGIEKSKGKYISFLDSDDEYLPNRLFKCYSLLEKEPREVAGVYTGCEFRRGGKTFHIEKNIKSGNFLVSTLACTFMFCTGSNLFIRKTVVDELGGFDGAFLRHQDYEFLVRLFENYSLFSLPEVLVIKNNENYNLPNVNKMIDIKKQYLEKYKSIIDSLPENDQMYIYHNQWISIAEAAQKEKNVTIAKKYYELAQRYGRLSIKEYLRRIVFTILR